MARKLRKGDYSEPPASGTVRNDLRSSPVRGKGLVKRSGRGFVSADVRETPSDESNDKVQRLDR